MPVEAATVAHLFQGNEVYGIGSVQRLYATHLPGLLFVCFGDGALHQWLRAHGHRTILANGPQAFTVGSSLDAALRLPAMLLAARRAAQALRSRLAAEDIRIVHTHWLPQQLIAAALRPAGFLAVWHIHNTMSSRRLLGFGPVVNRRLARHGADLVVAVSGHVAQQWVGSGVPVRIVHNAAEPRHAAPTPLPAGALRCIAAGRLDPSKGHHVALEAVLRARARGLDVRLDLVGGPLEGNRYAEALRRRIAQAGAGKAIRLLGFCPDVRARHPDYGLGLLCSLATESCSVWAIEALMDGLPLLASAIGGTPELVAAGETGWLYPAGDVDALAEGLLAAAADRQRLAAMRQQAFEHGRAHFRIERFVAQTLAAYAALDASPPLAAAIRLPPAAGRAQPWPDQP
jgi:glycosyltransferase involved in cell wall biosynthesis